MELDFSEEDLEFADRSALKTLISEVLGIIKRLAKSFDLGNALKNGVPVALVGAPNTGKSTLLNQLLGEERAIVSNIPGTTRDVIETHLNIDGYPVIVSDTAGIRESKNEIEKKGTFASPATALANKVFPVPGGPTSNAPFGIFPPKDVYFSGNLRKSTIS